MKGLQRWLDSWRFLSIEEASTLTGIWGVIIAISLLADSKRLRLRNLRKRTVIKWAADYKLRSVGRTLYR